MNSDTRVPGPAARPPSWKGVFPSSRDDDKYPMPPPTSYPFSLAPSKPRPIVGYPPVNMSSYKGYDYPSSYPSSRSVYPEHYPSDPYRSESPHSAAYSPPKYIKDEYRREADRYSPQRMDYPSSRHYEPTIVRRSPPVHPESYRSEHIPHSMYIDHHIPPRHDYPYDSYPPRHYESPLSTSIRRTDTTRSDPDRRAINWDPRRAESSPDFSNDPYHEESYERHTEIYRRSDIRRHEPAPKPSPPSPTYSSRPYSPYEAHPYPSPSPYAAKPRASPFPAERSRSPSPHLSDPHINTHSTPSPTPPAATPAPIFTMESPGGFSIGADGKAAAPHPKNPVKFEFKDFKENEYNLHSLQNSGGNTSLLSLKQQKRHKRIINRALAQGQARARARAQAEVGGSPQSDDKHTMEDHNDQQADRMSEERRKRALVSL